MTDAELKRELVRSAVYGSESSGAAPLVILKSLWLSSSSAVFDSGKTSISVAANGHNVAFSVLCPKDQFLRVVGQAIDWVEAQDDPTAPDLPLVTKRIRMCFDESETL